jgi:hypothetical protein
VDLVLVDQAFDTEAVDVANLLTTADIQAKARAAKWDVRLHQGLFILARLSEDMRAGLIPCTRLVLLTSHARPPIAGLADSYGGHLTKRTLITDPYRSLKGHMERIRPPGADVPAPPVGLTAQREGMLVALRPDVPVPWDGPILNAETAGPLCTEGPISLTIWAPAGTWARAFALLAMCKSARPEESLVLTDEPVSLALVPHDGRVALVHDETVGEVQVGEAAFSCRNLRDDEIFRSLLEAPPARRSELRPVLRLHSLSRTRHGREVLGRWEEMLCDLFDGRLASPSDRLRADLEELADAADRADRACAGGFHGLDRVVRGARAWETAARTYLQLAAAASDAASAAAERWLAATAGWHLEPEQRREALRVTAATALHRLVDDPWLGEEPSRRLFAHGAEGA